MTKYSRRELMKRSALTAAAFYLPANALQTAVKAAVNPAPQSTSNADLVWLGDTAPVELAGTTWGAPWPQGQYRPETPFGLATQSGTALPVQTWPLAYWPDGSLKWTGHAVSGASADARTANLRLLPGTPAIAPSIPVIVKETKDTILVDTGVMQTQIARHGAFLITNITRGGRIIASNARLIALCRDSPEQSEDGGSSHQERFTSNITNVVVEQKGPVRVVVRIDGKHQQDKGNRVWLPFTIRLYFYAGSESLRLLHTFVFDGDENKDFISGLGIRFDVPFVDTLQDRHVRFGGENGGLWSEAVRGLTGLRRDPGSDTRAAQVAGRATPSEDQLPGAIGAHLGYIPAWGDYTLRQPNADGFEIRKRTKPGHGWIRAGAGNRASGIGYVGGAHGGGIAFGLRDFYQRHPTQFDIRNAISDLAEVTVWLWSPDVPPMDLRFYHDGMGMVTHAQEREGLDVTYEDYEKGWGTPHGIARTNELLLWVLPTTPTHERLVTFASVLQDPPQLACQPAQIHAAGVFGNWSLPDRSTPAKKAIEDQLDYLLSLYEGQIDQRRWYGFWDYGDVMHSYDGDRHTWRYDVGGFAWANSELSPDLWLWYSFLRTGRHDVFRLAEATTRHTSEVDIMHLGQFQGFGSRHDVQHWGDSSKQPRVSTAAYRRMYYYLTADERTGDILREVLDADQRLRTIDIGRKIRPDGAPMPKPASASFGTDWCSFAAAWLTEWERTGNTKWRDKIVAGMQTIGALPKGWLAGGSAYDPDTGRFLGPGDTVSISHLNGVFGAIEINAELLSLLNVPEYEKAWLLYCEAFNAPTQERDRLTGVHIRKAPNLGEAHSRMTAYAAVRKSDPKLAARAWSEFFGGAAGIGVRTNLTTRHIQGPDVLIPVDEGIVMSTNASSQWGLAAIENLALIGDQLPTELPVHVTPGSGGAPGDA